MVLHEIVKQSQFLMTAAAKHAGCARAFKIKSLEILVNFAMNLKKKSSINFSNFTKYILTAFAYDPRQEFESRGVKARKTGGPRPLTPFTAALKLLALQKSGGGHGYPAPPPPPPPPVAWALLW